LRTLLELRQKLFPLTVGVRAAPAALALLAGAGRHGPGRETVGTTRPRSPTAEVEILRHVRIDDGMIWIADHSEGIVVD